MNLMKNNEAAEHLTEEECETANGELIREIVDPLLDEINAVRQIAEQYKDDPPAFAAVAMIEDEIDRAFEALQMESLVDVVIAYHRLKRTRSTQ